MDISITATSEAQMIYRCTRYLEARGLSVRGPNVKPRWMTPGQLASLCEISPAGLHKRLNSVVCPPYEKDPEIGKTQRILVHEKLIAYLRAPKAPGSQLKPPPSI